MNKNKILRAEIDRYLFGTLLQFAHNFSNITCTNIREQLTGFADVDVSTLNAFLAGRSQSLTPRIGDPPSFDFADDAWNKSEILKTFNKSPKEFLKMLYSAPTARYFYFPFNMFQQHIPGVPDFIPNMVLRSLDFLKEIWDKPLDVKYWINVIELFPIKFFFDWECVFSLVLKDSVVEQQIHTLENEITPIKEIPWDMIREFSELEIFLSKYSKKKSNAKDTGTVEDIIQEMGKREVIVARLKRFADYSLIFRFFSIRQIDIHLYKILYCLTEEKQNAVKSELLKLATSSQRNSHRRPDMTL